MNSLPLVTFSKVRISAQVAVCVVLAIMTCSASGQTFWQANPAVVGNWSTASNWTLGVPNASSGTAFDAVIANGGAAQLLVTGGSVRRLRVGRIEGSGGLYVESGGGLNVTENLHINEGGAGFGSMYVEGGGDVTAPATV